MEANGRRQKTERLCGRSGIFLRLRSEAIRGLAGLRIETEPFVPLSAVEIEHILQESGDGIKRLVSDAAEIPIVGFSPAKKVAA